MNSKIYEDYYLAQVGKGFPVHQGQLYQRGHGGLGNILSSIQKYAVPLLKVGSKYLGEKLIKAAANVATDVVKGKNIKKASKRRLVETGSNIKDDVKSLFFAKPPPSKKQRTIPKSINRPKGKGTVKKKKTQFRDIWS